MSIVICDVETTGLSPNIHRIVEVALARVDEDNWGDFEIETYRIAMSPGEFAMATPEALAVNGYYLGHPDWAGAPECDTPEASAIYAKIAERLHKAPLVNQRVSFDAGFLWAEIMRHGVIRVGGSTPYANDPDPKGAPWEGVTWNVEAFCRALMKKAGQKGFKLHNTYQLCSGPKLPDHRAEADVLRALWVMAEGRRQFKDIWPDFHIPSQEICDAVERWSAQRLQTTVSSPVPLSPLPASMDLSQGEGT